MKQWRPGEPLTESDYVLLQPLLDHAAATGMTPTVRDIPTASKIKNRFRIWKNAVMAAGLLSLNTAEQTRLREEMHHRIRTEQVNRTNTTEEMTVMTERDRHFSFYQNRQCEYFPCHENADENTFNCLFCYCPLYALGRMCGGNFSYTENGFKDCTNCKFPHRKENYNKVLERYEDIVKLIGYIDESFANGQIDILKK